MKGFFVVLGGLTVLILLLAVVNALGWGLTFVRVMPNTFSLTQVQITEGESVYFQNETGKQRIVLCLGKKGICVPHASGPSDLQNSGLTLEVDQRYSVEFDNQGIYTVTSPHDISMNLSITVSKASSGGYGNGGGSGGDDSSGGGGSGGDGGGGGGE